MLDRRSPAQTQPLCHLGLSRGDRVGAGIRLSCARRLRAPWSARYSEGVTRRPFRSLPNNSLAYSHLSPYSDGVGSSRLRAWKEGREIDDCLCASHVPPRPGIGSLAVLTAPR